MLSLFKEKLQSVQDGITLSLKGGDNVKTRRRDFYAGAKLLAKYQSDWEAIHSQSEENAKQAQNIPSRKCQHLMSKRETLRSRILDQAKWPSYMKTIDKQIEVCHDSIMRQRSAIRIFNAHSSDLNGVVTSTEKAVNAIGNIRTLIEEIQDQIIILEDLIETEENQKKMDDATQRFLDYRKDRLISFDALRERLAEDHDEKLKKKEKEIAEIHKQNFKEAEEKFREDITTFKETGVLPKKVSMESSLSIEEVDIDQDLEGLNKMLQS